MSDQPSPDIRRKFVTPSVKETAFNCPHCGALAEQTWWQLFAKRQDKASVPTIWTDERLDEILKSMTTQELEETANAVAQTRLRILGRPQIFSHKSIYLEAELANVFISRCFNCDAPAIWIYDRLEFPHSIEAPLPNPDLPADVLGDYQEAGAILNQSPRGAAALLRLAIQKICIVLGGEGDNINLDIRDLVAKGLDRRVQRALDVVRVIGNNAVHPGQIDLKDDRATAEKLFGLVNLIAEIMITQPKHIDQMYGGLPEGARQQIERRDQPDTSGQ